MRILAVLLVLVLPACTPVHVPQLRRTALPFNSEHILRSTSRISPRSRNLVLQATLRKYIAVCALRGGEETAEEFGSTAEIVCEGEGDGIVVWLHDYGGSGSETAESAGLVCSAIEGCRFLFPTAPERPVTPHSKLHMRNWVQPAASHVAEYENISATVAQFSSPASHAWEFPVDPTTEKEPPARLQCSLPLSVDPLPSIKQVKNVYKAAEESSMKKVQECQAQVAQSVRHVRSIILDLVQGGARPEDIVLLGAGQATNVAACCAHSLPFRLGGLVLACGTLSLQLGLKANSLLRGLPALVLHGLMDGVVLLDSSMQACKLLEAMGMQAELKTFEGGHALTRAALRELHHFLVQTLPVRAAPMAVPDGGDGPAAQAVGGMVRFGIGDATDARMDGWVAEALGVSTEERAPTRATEHGGGGRWKDWGKEIEFEEVADGSGEWEDDSEEEEAPRAWRARA